MKRRRIILALAIILTAVFIWAKTRPPADLTRVTMGFAGFEMVKGKRMAVFCVTNGSDTKIVYPLIQSIGGDPSQLEVPRADVIWLVDDGGGIASGWYWSDRHFRNEGIAPGEVHWTYVEPPDGFNTWRVKAHFKTIPFRHRLPPVLESYWPLSPNDAPVKFALKLSKIDLVHGRSVNNSPSKWEVSTIKILD